jgi:gliding-associated putative ABC transporter substrate-binding component GldG
MATSDHSARTLKYGTNVVVATILFFVVLVAVNYFAASSQKRLDLTRSQQYTVSEATRNLLHSLKDIVTVKVYATEQDTPPDWTEQRNQLRNLLYEYRIHSKGRLNYEFKDPGSDPKIEQEAQQKGVREQAMQKVGTTEYSLKAGYLGFVVDYKGKTETVGVLRPESSVEYQLTRAINKAAQINIPTVGVLAPAGNPYMGDPGHYTLVPQFLEQEGYKVKTLEASKLDLNGVDLVMMFEPEDLSEEALFAVDQYVMGGGKLFVAAGGVQIDQRSMRAQPKSPNINSILEPYGLRIDQNMLEDWGKAIPRLFQTSRGYVRGLDPFYIAVTDLSATSTITRDMNGLVLIYASSVSPSNHGTSATVEVLARTSNRTKTQEQFFNLEADKLTKPALAELETRNVAMLVKGELDSRFAAVDPPVITREDGTTHTVAASEVRRVSDRNATVVVMSCPLSFYNEVINPGSDGVVNALFMLNAADSMTRGGDMIRLRSKKADSPALKADITPAQAATAQAIAIGAVPVLLVLFGMIKYYLNRMKRLRYREIYGG